MYEQAANLQADACLRFLPRFFPRFFKRHWPIETDGPMYCSSNNQDCDPLEFLLSTDT